MKHHGIARGALLAGILTGILCAAPEEAHAEFRLTANVGATLTVPNSGSFAARNVMATGHLDATWEFFPWLHLGAYGRLHTNFGDYPVGWAVGGEFALRPKLPLLPVLPFGYFQAGFTRFPTQPLGLTEYGEVRLGAGLSIPMGSVFDFEFRLGAQQFFGNQGIAGNPFGLEASLGLALHL